MIQMRRLFTLSLLLWPLLLSGCNPRTMSAVPLNPTSDEQVLFGADTRIDLHRKGNLSVQVRDRAGQPLAGAEVRVEQTRHAFQFGTNVFNLDPASAEPWQRLYQARLTELFNFATLPFYWYEVERAPGQPDYSRLDRMVNWLRAQNLEMVGHPLVWSYYAPRWIPQDPDQIVGLLRGRVGEIIERYKGSVQYWDVVNEANNFLEANGVRNWLRRDGPVTYVSTALEWARAAGRGSDLTFIYNDYETGEFVTRLYAELARQNRLPDAFGVQSHMHSRLWSMREVWSTVDRMAQFDRPVRFTEITVLSGQSLPFGGPRPGNWVSTAEGEAAQAEYVERLYTVLFSHPRVESITWWDLSDRNAWQGAPAGLLRADMSPKPAYERLRDLIKNRWWTRAQGRTDRDGLYRTRAFLGSHRVTVTFGGQTQTATAQVSENEDGEAVVTVQLAR